jgi:hypothetical protein
MKLDGKILSGSASDWGSASRMLDIAKPTAFRAKNSRESTFTFGSNPMGVTRYGSASAMKR